MSTIAKTLNKYLNKYLSTKVVFLLDMIVSLAASLLTLVMVNMITVKSLLELRPLGIWMMSSFIFSFIFIWCIRTYRIIIRHMTFRELGRFVMVAFCKVMMVGFVFGMMYSFSKVLYVMMLADFFLTCAAFFLLRVTMLVVYDIVKSRLYYQKNCLNVLIYGIGDRAVSMIGHLQNSPKYKIVGFIQYGKASVDHVISEIQVHYVSSEKQFSNIVDETEAEAILFTSEQEAIEERDRLVKYAIDTRMKLLFAPPIDELTDGKITHGRNHFEQKAHQLVFQRCFQQHQTHNHRKQRHAHHCQHNPADGGAQLHQAAAGFGSRHTHAAEHPAEYRKHLPQKDQHNQQQHSA